MKIPTHLKHKPILEVPNYDTINGPYAGDSDAKGLSNGIFQWNTAGWTELSAKVWRNLGNKWSRESEALPLHSVLDLASQICVAVFFCHNDNNLRSLDDFPIHRTTENPELKHHIKLMSKELHKSERHLN